MTTEAHNAEDAARECDLIIFAAPAFLHATYFERLKTHVGEGCVIVGLPGQPGFEFEARNALGTKLDECVLVSFESSPWVCRLVEFGSIAEILGTKSRLVGAMQGEPSNARSKTPIELLQMLFGEFPRLMVSGHLLGISLRSPNACSHPPILYGRWRDWDGSPLNFEPLFYYEVDEETAQLLTQISNEILLTSRTIMREYPTVDLSQVIPIYDWDIGTYGDVIKDKTNLLTALRTNTSYAGIRHPMVKTPEGRYVPDFKHRFLTEDVPFGLAVVRGIAEIVGVSTPSIDTVLVWSQNKLQKEYLIGSKLQGTDIVSTRCPQKYGYATISDLLGAT